MKTRTRNGGGTRIRRPGRDRRARPPTRSSQAPAIDRDDRRPHAGSAGASHMDETEDSDRPQMEAPATSAALNVSSNKCRVNSQNTTSNCRSTARSEVPCTVRTAMSPRSTRSACAVAARKPRPEIAGEHRAETAKQRRRQHQQQRKTSAARKAMSIVAKRRPIRCRAAIMRASSISSGSPYEFNLRGLTFPLLRRSPISRRDGRTIRFLDPCWRFDRAPHLRRDALAIDAVDDLIDVEGRERRSIDAARPRPHSLATKFVGDNPANFEASPVMARRVPQACRMISPRPRTFGRERPMSGHHDRVSRARHLVDDGLAIDGDGAVPGSDSIAV